MNGRQISRRNRAKSESQPRARVDQRIGWWISLAILTATILSYRHVFDCGFINYDDDQYVYNNAHVRMGLALPSLRWALTATAVSNWHPLTWLSLELDHQLFGMNAMGYHAVNLGLHCVNGILLFWVLNKMTSAVWPSAAAAAIFALHPLHVESVAWVSERKDVLAGLFFSLALAAYQRFMMRRTAARYLFVCLIFALGLMTKPMLVTLPCVLLLLDYWPLDRFRTERWRRVAAEKLPLVALSCISCVITYLVQQHGGALKTTAEVSTSNRLLNVPVAYLEYLAKTGFPAWLAVYYPLPERQPIAASVTGSLLLLTVSAAAVLLVRRCRYFFVGWFWWLGMLVPVIGLVQVGGQAYADRYMYLPQIGLAIAVCWAVQDAWAAWHRPRWLLAAFAAAVFGCCSLATSRQVGFWHDSARLWRHAIDVTGPNPVACNSLGTALAENGQAREAVPWFKQCLELSPTDERAHLNLARILVELRRHNESIDHYRAALAVNPANAVAHFNLGVLLEAQDAVDAAMAEYGQAIVHDANYWRAHLRLARLCARRNDAQAANRHLAEALRINPELKAAGK